MALPELDPFIDAAVFLKEIEEDQDNLSEAMRKQTSMTAYYGLQHSKARKQKAKVELAVGTMEAQLTKLMRAKLIQSAATDAELSSSKVEKVTIDQVKAEVAIHKSMRELYAYQIDANEIEAVCRVCYDAFRVRRDMLTSQGLLAREAMKTNQTIAAAREEVQGSYTARRAARRSQPGTTPTAEGETELE